MKKRILSVLLSLVIVLTTSTLVLASDTTLIDDDFETSSLTNWTDNTGLGIKNIENDNENQYMALTSSGTSFYNYQANHIYSTGILYCEFDIKFTSGNMEIQLRESKDVSANGFSVAGRLRKTAYYLEYFTNGQHFIMPRADNSSSWFMLNDVSKWYTIKMVLNVKTNMYSMYVSNRDTQELLSKIENIDFSGSCNYINYFAFSSPDKLCIDNVLIKNIDAENMRISGEIYPTIPSSGSRTYTYIAKATNLNETISDVNWSIKTPKTGVNIEPKTGVLKVSAAAQPGPVLIYAEKEHINFLNSTYLIDLER